MRTRKRTIFLPSEWLKGLHGKGLNKQNGNRLPKLEKLEVENEFLMSPILNSTTNFIKYYYYTIIHYHNY